MGCTRMHGYPVITTTFLQLVVSKTYSHTPRAQSIYDMSVLSTEKLVETLRCFQSPFSAGGKIFSLSRDKTLEDSHIYEWAVIDRDRCFFVKIIPS